MKWNNNDSLPIRKKYISTFNLTVPIQKQQKQKTQQQQQNVQI